MLTKQLIKIKKYKKISMVQLLPSHTALSPSPVETISEFAILYDLSRSA